MIAVEAIVFDFDGVIADSETIANQTLAECLTDLGLPTSFEDCLRDYCGHNWRETQRRIEGRLGAPLPLGFRERQRARSHERFARELTEVPGASAFLERTQGFRRAVASSSSTEWLAQALARLGLAHHFGNHLYSAAEMERGKPHPDIYLAAARGLGVPPDKCLAIEDSPVGARAAVAAGMQVIGLVAAGHIHDAELHAANLRGAGAHRIAFSFAELEVRSASHAVHLSKGYG